MTVNRSGAIPTNYTICTSATRPPAPLAGAMIYETDTMLFLVYDGSAWQNFNTSNIAVQPWV